MFGLGSILVAASLFYISAKFLFSLEYGLWFGAMLALLTSDSEE